MNSTTFHNRSLPLDLDGSANPGQLQEVTLGTNLECTEGGVGGTPLLHRQSLGQLSPVRGRTIKEYDQQITELKNENFNLKLRIYFLEQGLGESRDDVHKNNIELKIEVESLKKDLANKQDLLVKASSALEAVEESHKANMDEMRAEFLAENQRLEERISQLQQALECESRNIRSESVSDDSNREELYQQAFPYSVDSTSNLNVQDMNEKVQRLSSELAASQTRAQELEIQIAEKDAKIKEEEINTMKRDKFIQGLVTSVKNTEKQYSQLRDKYDVLSLELKSTKEQLNETKKKDNERTRPDCAPDLLTQTDQHKTLSSSLENVEVNKQKLESDCQEALRDRDVAKQSLQYEKEKNIEILKTMEEITIKLQTAIEERNTIIQKCLQLLGIRPCEVTHMTNEEVVKYLTTVTQEKETESQTIIEEKVKVIQENENELAHIQEKFQENERLQQELKLCNDENKKEIMLRDNKIQDLVKLLESLKIQLIKKNQLGCSPEYAVDMKNAEVQLDLNFKLDDIKQNINKMMPQKEQEEVILNLQTLMETKNKEIAELQQKYQMKEDFISHLKDYLENLLDDKNCNKITDQRNSSFRRPPSSVGVLSRDASYFEKKLAELEFQLRSSSSKNKSLNDQLNSVTEKISVLKRLLNSIEFGAGDVGKIDFNSNKDLEQNMQVVVQGVKLLVNLNDIFRHQIQLSHGNSFNSQMIVDMAKEIEKLKTAQCSCQKENNICGNDEKLNNLHESQLQTVKNLQQKLSSTENTVRVLSTKLKHYKKLLHDTGLPAASGNKKDANFFTFDDESLLNQSSDKRNSEHFSCRSVSAEDLKNTNNTVFDDTQALSSDEVLDAVKPDEVEGRPMKLSLIKNRCNNVLNNSPLTPDSLLDYGQSSDTLELKEQICRLKLLLEQRESQLTELYSEKEAFRAISAASTTQHAYFMTSFLKEQSLTPSDHNFSLFYNEISAQNTLQMPTFTSIECQVGDGEIMKVEGHQFETSDEEIQWLNNVNAMLRTQLDVLISEIPHGNYSAFIQLQHQDISILRNRLLDSHDACELLRIRLEELAAFLEQLLAFDENGFLDISQLTPEKLESLKRCIAESRELSHSLSHSLLIDVADMSNVTSRPDSTVDHAMFPHSFNNNNANFQNSNKNTEVKAQMRTNSWISKEQISDVATEDDISPAGKINWKHSSPNNNLNLEIPLDNAEQARRNQSSCDDLILLLNPEQCRQQESSVYDSGKTNLESLPSNKDSSNDVRALDAFREQAIMAEYVRHYTSERFADDNDNRSNYVRTNHALSHHKDVVLGQGITLRARDAISPSDSESWSEPDRNVSQQRIGLVLEETSFSRERQYSGRSPKSLKLKGNSTTNGETSNSEHSKTILSKSFSSPKRKGHSDRHLQTMADLNDALKSEVKVYQTLLHNTHTERLVDHDASYNGKARSEKKRHSSGDKMKSILNGHLKDIRKLRLRLEESLRINEKLQEELESRLAFQKFHTYHNDNDAELVMTKLSDKEKILMNLDKKLQYQQHLETEELQQQISDLNDKLVLANSQLQQMEREIVARDEGSQHLKQANERLQNSIIHLQTAMTDKERVVKELRDANVRMQRTLETVNELMSQQQIELADANVQKEHAKAEIETTIVKYKSQIADLTRLIRDAGSQIADKEKALGLQEKDMQILKSDYETKCQECNQISVKFEELKVAVAQTEKQLENEHGRHLSLQQKFNDISQENAEKTNTINVLQGKISDFESLLSKSKKEFAEQREMAKYVQEKLGKTEQKVEDLQIEAEKLLQIIAENESNQEKQLKKSQNLQQKLEEYMIMLSQKEFATEKEKANRLKLEKRVRNLEDDLAASKQKSKLQNQAQETVYEDLQVKLDERSTIIRKLEEELHKAMEDNEKLQEHVLTIKTNLMETNELNKSMKTELNIYEHLQSSTRKITNQLPNTSSSLDIEQVLSEIRNLRIQLELSIQTNNALRSQLKEHLVLKLDGNTISSQRFSDKIDSPNENRVAQPSLNEHMHVTSHTLPVRKCSSFPFARKESNGEQNVLVRQHSKSSDHVSQEQSLLVSNLQKSKKERLTKLQLPTRCDDTMQLERSNSGQLDSHCIYSSPDLGIESDPSHFSSLEQKMCELTEEHLWEIRGQKLKVGRRTSLPGQNIKLGTPTTPKEQLLYVIGCIHDYEVLKREIEGSVTVLKGFQMRLKDRLLACSKNSSLKNLEYTALKELHIKSNNLNTSLGKSLKIIGSFWTALLPSHTILETKNPKLVEENLLLKKKLQQQKNSLQEALMKLAASNRLKEGMEKAIMKQLSKTHDVLKKAKGNLEDQAKCSALDK